MKARVCFICLILLAPASGYAELGRLFYTPEQRAGLEKARLQNRTQTTPIITIAPRPVTYDGVVLRSDGRSTRWVNGKPRTGGTYTLETRGKSLKPGQTLDGNQVYEAHGIRRTEMKETP